jgi:NADPH:quinone reductase-like Zn-dependent oxidoreductase
LPSATSQGRIDDTVRGQADRLRDIGVDDVIIDDGEVAPKLRQILTGGVDLALELVGAPTLRDTLRTLKVHGVACFTGMLSNTWVVKDFYPIEPVLAVMAVAVQRAVKGSGVPT